MPDSNNEYRGQPQQEDIPAEYLSISNAAKFSPYSAEYVSLLARRGRIHAKKFGRNWYTTRKAIEEYLAKHGIKFVVPADEFISNKDALYYTSTLPKILKVLRAGLPETGEVKSAEEIKKEIEKESVPIEKIKIEEVERIPEVVGPDLIAQWDSLEQEQEQIETIRESAKAEIAKIDLSHEPSKVESEFVEPLLATEEPISMEEPVVVEEPAEFQAVLAEQPQLIEEEELELEQPRQPEVIETEVIPPAQSSLPPKAEEIEVSLKKPIEREQIFQVEPASRQERVDLKNISEKIYLHNYKAGRIFYH